MAPCGTCTGFDCGDPFCRRKIDRTIRTATERNSLCQFWNDSNQNFASVTYSRSETGDFPSATLSSLTAAAPDAAWIYRCADHRTDLHRVTARVVGARDYRDRHHAARALRTETEHMLTEAWGERWTACSGCAELIEARDIYGLIGRVVEAMPAKYTRGNRLVRVRGDLHSRYSTVFDTLAPGRGRIEPGHPLGVWPAPPDKAPDEASDGPS